MKDLKAIAIYLPQYHRIKENDEWWGEGYTEWTAVRQADKFYEGHDQPRVPLNNNYYDLMQKETMQWQANLARKYGIYGFCFYHYYFKDGRKILERPAENLLLWPDVDMKYCFSWANESWVRTWSKMSGGTMASKFERFQSGSGEPLLLQQTYGDEKEWKEHFEYLLPFFKDERYIKVDGKPVFLFHLPEKIDCLEKMAQYWRKMAAVNGLQGIYLIGVVINSYQEFPMLDAIYAHEPRFLFNDYIQYSDESKKGVCSRYNLYEEVCQWIGSRKYFQKQKMYYGAFAGFDSTPRHGIKGVIIDKVTPELFEKHLRDMCHKNWSHYNEFVFINAWNEWGECNYLEPDVQNGFGFLEAVKKVMSEDSDFQSSLLSAELETDVFFRIIREREAERDKFKNYYMLMDQWMVLLENKDSLIKYFQSHNYRNMAIYGFGSLGRHLFNQLKEMIDIRYIIDQKVAINNFNIPIFHLEDDLPKADVVIVTVTGEFKDICDILCGKFEGDVVSLGKVVKECL